MLSFYESLSVMYRRLNHLWFVLVSDSFTMLFQNDDRLQESVHYGLRVTRSHLSATLVKPSDLGEDLHHGGRVRDRCKLVGSLHCGGWILISLFLADLKSEQFPEEPRHSLRGIYLYVQWHSRNYKNTHPKPYVFSDKVRIKIFILKVIESLLTVVNYSRIIYRPW